MRWTEDSRTFTCSSVIYSEMDSPLSVFRAIFSDDSFTYSGIGFLFSVNFCLYAYVFGRSLRAIVHATSTS